MSFFNLLNRNWLLHVALRVASGTSRARKISTVRSSSCRESLSSARTPSITCSSSMCRPSSLVGYSRLPVSSDASYYTSFFPCPRSRFMWRSCLPCELLYSPTVSSNPFDAPLISTAPEVTSPGKEEYREHAPSGRILHVWDPVKFGHKSQPAKRSIYEAASSGERARARLSASGSSHGRALLSAKPRHGNIKPTYAATKTTLATHSNAGTLAWIYSVIDSGCSWHVHYRAEDLINLRPSMDTFRGIDKRIHKATGVGDIRSTFVHYHSVERTNFARFFVCPNGKYFKFGQGAPALVGQAHELTAF